MQITNIAIDKLNPATYNPRLDLQPEDKEYQDIKRSIVEFGLVEPLVINKGNIIVGGHQRYKVLKELNFTTVPCITIDLDKQKEKMLNIALNKISGDWDRPRLKDLLEELDSGEFDVSLTGWGQQEMEDLMTEFHVDPEEDDFDVDKAVEEVGEPICKRGDIWQLGDHRLMCGDATVEEDVKQLIKDDLMDMSFCDPPYNIGYDYWDYLDKKEVKEYKKWCEVWFKYLTKNVSIVVLTIGKWNLKMWYEIEKPLGTAIWIARNKTSGSKISLFSVWEPILVYAKKIKRRKISNDILNGDLKISDDIVIDDIETAKKYISENNDIFEINNKRQKGVGTHKCPKQLTLMREILKRYSIRGQNCIDFFLGSGSTLIACEQTKRKCYGMEIDPIYCDVIIKRWEEYTNKKAVIING